MVVVAQLVRAPDCGSGGRRFETALPPKIKPSRNWGFFSFLSVLVYICKEVGNVNQCNNYTYQAKFFSVQNFIDSVCK